MPNIVDKVFNEVCLDERVSDGIFRMEEEQHMNALRDYFIKRGITKEVAISVSNRMVEGRFPERQAYNEDGILVTFPTPKHKAEAIKRGTHFEKNPHPENQTPPKEEKPEPIRAEPTKSPVLEPKTDDKEDDGEGKEPISKPNIFQGSDALEVEPDRGSLKPEPAPPSPPVQPVIPKTPEIIAAEKEVIKQILSTDDTAWSSIEPKIGMPNNTPKIDEQCLYQLNELYKKADEWGMYKAADILKSYIK